MMDLYNHFTRANLNRKPNAKAKAKPSDRRNETSNYPTIYHITSTLTRFPNLNGAYSTRAKVSSNRRQNSKSDS